MSHELKISLFPSGNVLLSTILIMGLALNIGLIIAVLTLSGLNRSGALRSQAVSYYAAESGIESSLYKTRKAGLEIADFLDEAEANIETNASWQASGKIETQSLVEDLEENQSLILYLYNPESWGSGIKELSFNWQDTCSGNSVLSVWLTSPIEDQADFDNIDWFSGYIYRYDYLYSQVTYGEQGLVLLSLEDAAAYGIKLIANNCYINYLKIEGKDASGNVVPLNLESVITATGSSRDVKQTIRVSM